MIEYLGITMILFVSLCAPLLMVNLFACWIFDRAYPALRRALTPRGLYRRLAKCPGCLCRRMRLTMDQAWWLCPECDLRVKHYGDASGSSITPHCADCGCPTVERALTGIQCPDCHSRRFTMKVIEV